MKSRARFVNQFGGGIVLVLTFLFFVGCHQVLKEDFSPSDPQLQPFFKAMESVDRTSMGFTAISTNANIKIQWGRSTSPFDAMLHVYGDTSRTISFRKTPDGYRWVHEQEIHTGPGWRQTVDGTLREQIVIEFQTEPINGIPTNEIHLTYMPAGTNGMWQNPTLPEAQALLAKWKTAPVEPQPPDLPVGDVGPLAIPMLVFLLGVLAIGSLAAVAILSLALTFVAMLLIGGIISSSLCFAILRRSIAGGFRALFLQIGAVLGAAGGIAATLLASALHRPQWHSGWRWPLFVAIGVAFGIFAAWLFNHAWMRVAKFLQQRVKPQVGETRA